MIGAIKRRWKSKKAKVLHKGGELSASTDSCPTSRGFVDGPEDFDKMIKPPSPRQVHPVLEKGDMKYGAHPYLQHQQHPARKKSLTLPSSEEGCPFIRVNSGRIELVSKESWKGNSPGLSNDVADKIILADSRLGGRLRNDTRHSWCGSAFRQQQNEVAHQKKSLLLEDEVVRCGSQSQNQGTSGGGNEAPHSQPQVISRQMQLQMPILENGHSVQCNGVSIAAELQEDMQVSLSPLRERLAAIEGITANLQTWQSKEKTEYEQCVSDLATQVSRAVALQQLMKSEVEKLQQRVVHLENHNKAMATMIIPTLMKLHDTVGKESATQTKSPTNSKDENMNIEKNCTVSEKETKLSQNQSNTISHNKSPKHRKFDCRIPRINCKSNRTNSSMTTSAPNPAVNNDSEQLSTEQLANNNRSRNSSSNSRTCVESSPSLSLSLSPSHSNRRGPKSDHSNNSSNAQRVSCQRSSTYSGIPRMSSPRPANRVPGPFLSKQSTGFGGKESRNRKIDRNNGHSENSGPVTSTPLSKLPIRKNLSTSSTSSSCSSSSAKPHQRGNSRSNTHPKTATPSPLLTMNDKGSLGSKINTNTYVKSKPTSSTLLKAMTMTINSTTTSPTVSGKPKAGKDEGYSTMSSEALAEQEKSEETQNCLEKMKSGSNIIKSNTFNTLREMTLMANSDNYNSYNHNTNKSNKKGNGRVGEVVQSLPKEKFQMMCNGNVRIYRGAPYEIEIGVDGEGDSEEPSTSTILWEDSDDSDILFLPLEMSSEVESTIGSSSRSTLVPSVSSISYRDRDKNRSSGTVTPSSRSTSRTPNGKLVPQIFGSDKESGVSPLRKSINKENGKMDALVVVLNSSVGVGGNSDEMEERALIEKWMRLEDVRNEVQWDDEWAWDWDGVERTHKSLQVHNAQGSPQTIISHRSNPNGDDEDVDVDADVEFWFSSPSSESSPEKVLVAEVQEKSSCVGKEPQETKNGISTQIDSSTWTKSKARRLKCKLVQENEDESLELKCNSLEKEKKQETFSLHGENEKEILAINGESEVEGKEEVVAAGGETNEMSPSLQANTEDGVAPVIEFTPEFYHLVNYGSNLSFSDNDSSSQSHHNSNHTNQQKRNSDKVCKVSSTQQPRKCKLSSNGTGTATSPNSNMDDKISQTDFSSSHENLSVSSELFTECRNCLEIIKKLVGSTAISMENCGSSDATLDRKQKHERAEMRTDVGCPTTWLSVPKGLPTTEVDRILEILSSSESEDVLSPSK